MSKREIADCRRSLKPEDEEPKEKSIERDGELEWSGNSRIEGICWNSLKQENEVKPPRCRIQYELEERYIC